MQYFMVTINLQIRISFLAISKYKCSQNVIIKLVSPLKVNIKINKMFITLFRKITDLLKNSIKLNISPFSSFTFVCT